MRDAEAAAAEEGRNLGWELSTAVVLFHEAVARRSGLSAADHKALGLIARLGPLTAGEIARHTGLSPAAVTGLIDRLEAAGYVQRERDPQDRRRVIVHAIPGGGGDLDQVFGNLSAAMEEMISRYEASELAVIRDYVVRTIEVLREQTRRLSNEEAEDSGEAAGPDPDRNRGGHGEFAEEHGGTPC